MTRQSARLQAKSDTKTKTISKPETPSTKKHDGTKQKVKPVKAEDENSLDMCLLLDCTASMGTWIERSKDTLKEIITNVK